jgi:hypothetical protein
MRAPGSLDRVTVNHLGTRPAFRGAHQDHWPERMCGLSLGPRGIWNSTNLVKDGVARGSYELMHNRGIVALEMGIVTVTDEQARQLMRVSSAGLAIF